MKLVAALIVLLHSFSASADDHMFSYSMSMANFAPKADKGMGGMPKGSKGDKEMGGKGDKLPDGKGMGGPGGKGDKLPDVGGGISMKGAKTVKGDSGKGGSGKGGSGKGGMSKGKGKFDGCEFRNPVLQGLATFADPSTFSDAVLLDILEHQNNVNKEYFGPMVSKWVSREVTPSQVAMVGAKASHPIPSTIGVSACDQICANVFALVLQMANTCQDKKFLAAYANVAAALMSGFANPGRFGGDKNGSNAPVAGSEVNILQCVYKGKTFQEMYAKQLTEATIMTVDFGRSCPMIPAPSQMPSGSSAPSKSSEPSASAAPSHMPSTSSEPSRSAAPSHMPSTSAAPSKSPTA